MAIEEIGCCGAYCGTCKEYKEKRCNGCKIGYLSGERDINKAKCKMKVCCIKRKHNSCADCSEYLSCNTINEFYSKNGYKYKKYKQAIDYIREHGYDKFLQVTEQWTNVYGRY